MPKGIMMREHKILMRVSEIEKQLMDQAAKDQGLATASWARLELLRAARKYYESLGEKPVPTPGAPVLLSLFCGPGGLDQGFQDAGFHSALAFDIDVEAVNTFRLNHSRTTAEVVDVTQLTIGMLDDYYGGTFKPDGVIGGPPCQSFSVSNVHQREDDPRHLLPRAYANLLKELNRRHPISFFLFENVLGLQGKKHRVPYEDFKARFQEAGFVIYEEVLDAKHYGVPQERKRIIIVGINQRKHPGGIWIPPKPESRIRTVRETIEGLEEPVRNARGLDPETFPVHPNHWCPVPRSSKFENGRLEEGQMYGRSFRTLRWDQPSWTVAYGHREVHVHPDGHRRLSVYEAMLLQAFPSNYRLTGHMSAQIRLVSEAVPVRLAWHIARSIRNSLGV